MADTVTDKKTESGNRRRSVFDASKLPQSNDPAEILRQVEFYFSDANFPRDKFLWETAQKNEGWVPIKTIHSFARMKRFPEFETVVAALRESPELLEVSEDGEKVRRKKALTEPEANERQAAFERTVYAKGFGEETETLQYDIEVFFQQYGKLNQVRLRRTNENIFKGSVFVEFENLEDANAFLKADPKPTYKDNELLTMSKHAYVDMKSQEQGFTANANGHRRRKFNGFRSKPVNAGKKRKRDDRRSGNSDSYKSQKTEDNAEAADVPAVAANSAASETSEPKEAAPSEATASEAQS